MLRKIILAIMLSLTSMISPILAQDKLTFSGLMFSQYQIDKSINGFSVSRLYLTCKRDINNRVHFRATTDIGKVAGLNHYVYLKYVYVSIDNIVPQSTLLLGLHYLPLLAYEENVWGYRSVSKVMMDLQHKQTSSDFGIGLQGRIFKSANYAVSIVNGEGYTSLEDDNEKAFHSQLTIPIDSVRISLFQSLINDRKFVKSTTTFYLLAIHTKDRVGVEISLAKETEKPIFTGVSMFNIHQIATNFYTLIRGDIYAEDNSNLSDLNSNRIIGISYKYSDNLIFAFDYQYSKIGQFFVHMESTF